MNSIIFVRLMGGLGNQLFQYAAGLLQAAVTNGRLYLQKPVENIHDTNDYRSTLFTLGEPYDGPLPYHLTLYQEDGFASWNPLHYNDPILLLYGYFQNYNCLKPILAQFKPHMLENLKYSGGAMLTTYNINSSSGFIHVRRGDYLKLNNVLDTVYYSNALKHFNTIHTWYVLSDDITWCKESKLFDSLNKIYVEESDPVVCLALMAEIKGAAIIANSTFSWMGAYLGCGTSNVIYPKVWINSGTPDLFPEEWIGL